MDILNLLTRLLMWLVIGYFLWWVILKFKANNFLTWFGGAIILAMIAASFLAPNDGTIGTIWQFLAFPLTPLGGAITLLVMALAPDLKKTNIKMVIAALIILLVASTPLVARILVNQSEDAVQRAYDNQRQLCLDICPAVDSVPIDRAVSMVVIGENADAFQRTSSLPSRTDSSTNLDPILVSRLNSTADVYGRISAARPFVTVTAGSIARDSESGQQLDGAIRQQLVNRGIPGEGIRITNTGLDVRGAVTDQRGFLDSQGLLSPVAPEGNNRDANRVILVAPALKMRRAALAFEDEGLQVVAAPTELYGNTLADGGDAIARLGDLVPNVDALRLTTRYWQELLSSFYYYLRGWLPSFSMQWDQVVETLQQP
ncbi:MAG: YdcF family protein [Nodosilinea sp.]